jgi:hypothetical protein
MSGAPSVALCRERTTAELLATRSAKVEAFQGEPHIKGRTRELEELTKCVKFVRREEPSCYWLFYSFSLV